MTIVAKGGVSMVDIALRLPILVSAWQDMVEWILFELVPHEDWNISTRKQGKCRNLASWACVALGKSNRWSITPECNDSALLSLLSDGKMCWQALKSVIDRLRGGRKAVGRKIPVREMRHAWKELSWSMEDQVRMQGMRRAAHQRISHVYLWLQTRRAWTASAGAQKAMIKSGAVRFVHSRRWPRCPASQFFRDSARAHA